MPGKARILAQERRQGREKPAVTPPGDDAPSFDGQDDLSHAVAQFVKLDHHLVALVLCRHGGRLAGGRVACLYWLARNIYTDLKNYPPKLLQLYADYGNIRM